MQTKHLTGPCGPIHQSVSQCYYSVAITHGAMGWSAVCACSNSLTYSHFSWLIYSFISSPVTGPRSAVGNVSGYRCVSDCRSRGHEFDPGPVPYFRGD